jgi:hypothetical protein
VLIGACGEGANSNHELPNAVEQKDYAHGYSQERVGRFAIVHL